MVSVLVSHAKDPRCGSRQIVFLCWLCFFHNNPGLVLGLYVCKRGGGISSVWYMPNSSPENARTVTWAFNSMFLPFNTYHYPHLQRLTTSLVVPLLLGYLYWHNRHLLTTKCHRRLCPNYPQLPLQKQLQNIYLNRQILEINQYINIWLNILW